jgi:cysteine-rich repeat protein
MRCFELFAVSVRRRWSQVVRKHRMATVAQWGSIPVVAGVLFLAACPLPQTIDAEVYCGNGVVEAEESCDDGNAEDTDDCLSTCVLASCGDGLVHAENEACDDGNADSSDDCNENCETARCGDGFVWVGEEACDDGNANDGDDCSNACEDQSHLVNNFSGQEGPVIGEGWRQCAGYLDRRDREDIPQEWGSACALEGMGKVRLYCGASALQSKFIEVDRNVFREGLGAGINAGTPARGLITRSSWGTGNDINMSNFIWADGRPSHPHAGKSHWGSDGSSCAWRIERRLIVNGPGCSYEAADCFGQNPDDRYLWVYVKP